MSYNYIVAAGHTPSGTVGSGAGGEAGQLDESNCTREIAPLVVSGLNSVGQSAKYSVFDRGNYSLYEDCYTRAANANADGCNLYVEVHLNAGGGRGCEVVVDANASQSTYNIASNVSSAISNQLGIPNRGVKNEKLIVLRKTSMPAILIEVCFVDSSDVSIYNAQAFANAIVYGLTGQTVATGTKLGWNKNETGWWYCTDVANGYYYKSNWKQIDGYWYSFDDNGYAMEAKWYLYGGKWYYLKPKSCQMAKSEWVSIDGYFYCFNEDGILYVNCKTPDGYQVNEDGEWIK